MAHQKRFSGTLLSASLGVFVGLSSLSAQATVCKSDAECTGGALCIGGVAPNATTPVPNGPTGGATSIGSGAVSGTVVVTGGNGGNAGEAASPTAGGASGSGGSSGSTGDGMKPAPDPVPSTSFVGFCQAPAKVCKSTTECPADYTCYRPFLATPCARLPPTGGAGGSVVTPTPATGASSGSSSGSGGSIGSSGSVGAGNASGSSDPTVAVPPDYKCDSTPVQSDTGTCQPAPHACKVATDCPAPLTCGATTCTGGDCPSTCTFNATTCTADSDCGDANTECATVSKSSWCTGSGGVACSKDGACTPVETPPPVCGSTETKQCMPKRIDCSAGQTCPTGWSCYDSSDHAMAAPSWWKVTGPVKVCMPAGIIMAVDGHADGAYNLHFSGMSYGSADSGGGAVTTGKGPTAALGSAGSTGNNGSSSSETAPTAPLPVSNSGGTQAASSGGSGGSHDTAIAPAPKSEGGGCSFGGGSSGAWGLVLTGLAFALGMRRRRQSS